MAGYAYVGNVQDPNAKQALINAFDLIATLRAEIAGLKADALQRGAAMNAAGYRLTNLGAPEAVGDAVSVAYLRAYVAAQLEAFKGLTGVTASIDTTVPTVIQVENGIITEVTT